MRNYVKLRALSWTADSTNVFPPSHLTPKTFALNDTVLFSRRNDRIAQIIAFNNPARVWTFNIVLGPMDVWILLSAGQIDKIVSLSPEAWWDNTIPPDQESTVILPGVTVTDKSPRATWPTKLGTDGQRLRSGRTKDDGAALNYIGKLYFLTSKTAFKTIWNLLSSGKITAKEALARANALT